MKLAHSKASEYHHLYDKALWKRLRKQQLAKEPLCAICLKQNRITEATICDHIEPHKGDEDKFYDADNLQSLCKLCHDSDKAMLERHGKQKAIIGNDGWPVN